MHIDRLKTCNDFQLTHETIIDKIFIQCALENNMPELAMKISCQMHLREETGLQVACHPQLAVFLKG